jgi:transcriptional regulator with XRE-family HTH domain
MALGDYLRAKMVERDLTQVDVAALIGVSQPLVSSWLSGADPRLSTVARVALAFGDPIEKVVTTGLSPAERRAVWEHQKAVAERRLRQARADLDWLLGAEPPAPD